VFAVSDSYRASSAVTVPGEPDTPPLSGTELLKRLWERFLQAWREIAGRISFWTVVSASAILSTVYYFVFAEPLYDSQAIVSLQNKSSVSTGASSVLGGMLGTSAGGTQTEQVYQYIISLDMLKILDKQFNLRTLYASSQRNPFWRLWWPDRNDSFLAFYQDMVEVVPDTTNSIITIDVLDYDAHRSQAIAQKIISQSQQFMNQQSGMMQAATMKFAQNELQNAVKAVQAAKLPYEQQIAEIRLSAAQSALATATGLANQQQTFVVPISVPALPTDAAHPEKLLDIAGIIIITAITYAVCFLMWANVRDHRKA
jgi:capsule polysaccharide export protein KpsE/RkpR